VREVWDRYRADHMASQTRPEQRRRWNDFYDQALPLPDSVPVLVSLRVDASSNVWAERYRLPWDTVPRWDVFDEVGRWLGAVSMPRDFTVYEIGRDHVLGRHRDELGVERIRLHALRRSGVRTGASAGDDATRARGESDVP
jgi:hypothetical protein